jgi:hypothetical protein
MKNSTIIIIGIVGVAIVYYMLKQQPSQKEKVAKKKPFAPSYLNVKIKSGAEFNNQNAQQSQEEESEFCGCGA